MACICGSFVCSPRRSLSCACSPRRSVSPQVVPLLLSWCAHHDAHTRREAAPQHAPAHHGAHALPHRYARTRREAAMTDACALACHIAFAYSSIAASQADDARTAAMVAGASKSVAAAAVYDARDELPLFALLSSRYALACKCSARRACAHHGAFSPQGFRQRAP